MCILHEAYYLCYIIDCTLNGKIGLALIVEVVWCCPNAWYQNNTVITAVLQSSIEDFLRSLSYAFEYK